MAQNSIAWDRVEEATQRLITLFESGELPKALQLDFIRVAQGARPSDAWSLGNRLLMLLAGTDDARGYRQWEAVGRHVKKGAKAFYILAPLTRMVEETDPETGEKRERVIVRGFKTVPVFRLEDTEGEPVTYLDLAPPRLPPLAEIAQAWGYRITYGPGDGRCYGWTSAGAREIHLMTTDRVVYWHELGHAADARTHDLQGGQHPDQEIVAETVAATVALLYGEQPARLAWSRDYIEGYARSVHKSSTAAMMSLLARVQQALQEIAHTAALLEREPVSA